MAGKAKRRVKKLFKELFCSSASDSEPSAPSTQRTITPVVPVTNPEATNELVQPVPPPPVVSSSDVQSHGSAQPAPAPIPPARPTAKPSEEYGGWPGLQSFFGVLSESSAMFGPIREVVDIVLESINTFKAPAQHREEYRKLSAELKTLLGDLDGFFGASTPPVMYSSVTGLARKITQELELAQKEHAQSKISGYMNSEADEDAILDYSRRIQSLREQLKLNIDMNMWKIIDEGATETRLSRLPSSPAAEYRSAKSSTVFRGECTPNTRVKVLKELYEWACDSKGRKMYWLNGMAGTGKTTIAYSLCKRLEASHGLAASFFCSRQLEGCHDVDLIFPTISRQLSHFSRPYRSILSQVLEKDPKAHNQPLLDQFKQLIVEPLNKAKEALPTNLVIVIDALDECDNDRGEKVVEALLSCAQDLPIKVFVTSRSDARILDLTSRQQGEHVPVELRLHNLESSIVKEDIKTYLLDKLDQSRMDLSAANIDVLVERSGALFIYAATVVRYLAYDNFAWAKGRLKNVLNASKHSSDERENDINTLYTTILKVAFKGSKPAGETQATVKLVLDAVICAQEPLSVDIMAGLLGLEADTVHAALRPMFSVLQVSDTTHVITTLHKSFPDYMLDESRSGAFYCNLKERNALLAQTCFNQIKIPNPPFNICNLKSSYEFDKDVPDLAPRVEKAISKQLLYACRYWGEHLMSANINSHNLASVLCEFLSKRFLLWMEVMNLRGYIYDGAKMLHRMQKWTLNVNYLDKATGELLQDAWRFVTSFCSNPTMLGTPHIYVSSLAFWPEDSPITRQYPQQQLDLIARSSTAMRKRKPAPLAIVGTKSPVRSVAYSPDGAYIASGSEDNTIRIWDARTGQQVGEPLEGHINGVGSVAYSPDGAYIASGSWDKTIRIWDARTGQQVGEPLEGHINGVGSVAYSPDGAYIASGSNDNTIRIWDARTGQQVGQPLEGHTHSVLSIAYSPDGAYIASGSWDETIRIWDVRTGQQVGKPLEGHINGVWSVAYSPDGAYIAFGSYDNTIRIWDARTGQQVGQPLEGHTNHVWSVAYSPDSAYIASGSYDNTIRIWDARTGQQVGKPLEGHTSYVQSVAYSPDGAYIASGSYYNTIRIWDARTGQQVGQPLEGHTNGVRSVAYSPDGAYIASGSNDHAIRVWDMQSGGPIDNMSQADANHTQTANLLHATPSVKRTKPLLVKTIVLTSIGQ
ncbi:hypothetical protein FRC07_003330 [Ceratobasidium sp. 392]|nr:hypothetical protein FRC07_003330 [Ceratobasidium sp. 392]